MGWVSCPCQWWVSEKQSFDGRVGCWGELYSFFWGIYLTLQIPLHSMWQISLQQSWVQLHKITSITITITLKYRLQLQLQLHHHNVILNYNYNYTMLISITITITVPFLRKCYFFMMEYWVNRFWVVFSFWPEHCVVTLPPLSLPTLCGSIISRHTCAGHLY